MDILARFKRDDARITNGFKFIIGPDCYIRVARMHESNPQFKTLTESLARSRQHEIDNAKGAARTAIYTEIAEEAFVRACVTEMHNVSIGDDAISADAVGVARLRSEVPELFNDLMTAAMKSENYVGEFDEETSLKN